MGDAGDDAGEARPPRLSVVPLGVGRGADAVFLGRCSTSLLVLADGQPLLLVDAGFGVVRAHQALAGDLACALYVSHNHSDHAAELPVIGAVMRQRGQRLPLLAERGVMARLREHRLHELRSTGEALDAFFHFQPLDEGDAHPLGQDFSLRPVRGAHGERSFGFVLSAGAAPCLAVSADSAFDEQVYTQLAAAPVVILDGRAQGTSEHAGFDEIAAWAASRDQRSVWITGYGEADTAPRGCALCRPGQAIAVPRPSPGVARSADPERRRR